MPRRFGPIEGSFPARQHRHGHDHVRLLSTAGGMPADTLGITGGYQGDIEGISGGYQVDTLTLVEGTGLVNLCISGGAVVAQKQRVHW